VILYISSTGEMYNRVSIGDFKGLNERTLTTKVITVINNENNGAKNK